MGKITAVIHKGDKYYIGECLEIDVVTQGKTIDEVLKNLNEAVNLYFEGEDIESIDLPSESPIVTAIEVGK